MAKMVEGSTLRTRTAIWENTLTHHFCDILSPSRSKLSDQGGVQATELMCRHIFTGSYSLNSRRD